MGTISIKIRNSYGVNKLKGEDLTLEESMALIELAKNIALHGEASWVPTPITLDELTTYEEATDLHTVLEPSFDENKHNEGSDDANENDTNVEPIANDVLNNSASPKGMPILANAISSAFATKFGTSPTTAHEDSSMLSTEEQLEELNKDFYETGVKHKLYGGEIVPFYRVRWDCPKCSERGNHYGPENIKQMFCYNCNAALNVRPAAGKFPNRDEWGNFFVANELNIKYTRA